MNNDLRNELTLIYLQDKQARIDPLVAEISTLPKPTGEAAIEAGCKPTAVDMRRAALRLRTGRLRPRDPNTDPIELAVRLEKEIRFRELAQALSAELLDSSLTLDAVMRNNQAELHEGAMHIFLTAKQLANEPGSNLEPHVRAMRKALRREKGRG